MADRITGPIPIYLTTTPTAVVLDLDALTRLVVGDVLDVLLHPEDTTAWDRLHELANPTTAPTAEGRLPYEELVDALAEQASSRVPLYGTKALDLADRLRALAGPRPIREAGAA